jgi:hypothetical protein
VRLRQLSDLQLDVQKRADVQNATSFMPLADITELINQGWTRVYGLLCDTGEDYYRTQNNFNTVAGQNTYYTTNDAGAPAGTALLPTDLYKIKGVDMQAQQSPGWCPCDRFEFQRRCDYDLTSWGWPVVPMYDYSNSGNVAALWFIPQMPASVPVRLWYYPAAVRMANNADTIDGGNGWEIYAIDWAAKRVAVKDENWDLVQVISQDLLEMEARIKAEGANRNAGQAFKMQRRRYRKMNYGFGPGSMGPW